MAYWQQKQDIFKSTNWQAFFPLDWQGVKILNAKAAAFSFTNQTNTCSFG